ncbi:hypothetical protein QUB60_25135 [Microcoleus sp. A2-C5]
MLPPAVERAIAPAVPNGNAEESTDPAVVSIAPVPAVTKRVMSPAEPALELERRPPVVMLPPAVERAIAPPFPD